MIKKKIVFRALGNPSSEPGSRPDSGERWLTCVRCGAQAQARSPLPAGRSVPGRVARRWPSIRGRGGLDLGHVRTERRCSCCPETAGQRGRQRCFVGRKPAVCRGPSVGPLPRRKRERRNPHRYNTDANGKLKQNQPIKQKAPEVVLKNRPTNRQKPSSPKRATKSRLLEDVRMGAACGLSLPAPLSPSLLGLTLTLDPSLVFLSPVPSFPLFCPHPSPALSLTPISCL